MTRTNNIPNPTVAVANGMLVLTASPTLNVPPTPPNTPKTPNFLETNLLVTWPTPKEKFAVNHPINRISNMTLPLMI